MNLAAMELKNIKKSFNSGLESAVVLNNVSISFIQSKTYAIQGVSGTGKSTLMHIIAGLDNPDSGSLTYNNKKYTEFTAQEKTSFFQNKVGFLFQNPYLIKELSVFDNIILPSLVAGHISTSIYEYAYYLLDQVGIGQKAHNFPGTLSGGQQQRVALARALINKPSFLLADEPTGNLDEKTAVMIIELIQKLQKELNMGIIVSTHDVKLAQIADYRYILHDGILSPSFGLIINN